MAVCKRCGTVFQYEKRDGVCPKCCYFNRPAVSVEQDESWVQNYNFDDNTFEFPKISSEEILEGSKKKSRTHFHSKNYSLEDLNKTIRTVTQTKQAKTAKSVKSVDSALGKKIIQTAFVIVFLIILLSILLPGILGNIYEKIMYEDMFTPESEVEETALEPAEIIPIYKSNR